MNATRLQKNLFFPRILAHLGKKQFRLFFHTLQLNIDKDKFIRSIKPLAKDWIEDKPKKERLDLANVWSHPLLLGMPSIKRFFTLQQDSQSGCQASRTPYKLDIHAKSWQKVISDNIGSMFNFQFGIIRDGKKTWLDEKKTFKRPFSNQRNNFSDG